MESVLVLFVVIGVLCILSIVSDWLAVKHQIGIPVRGTIVTFAVPMEITLVIMTIYIFTQYIGTYMGLVVTSLIIGVVIYEVVRQSDIQRFAKRLGWQ